MSRRYFDPIHVLVDVSEQAASKGPTRSQPVSEPDQEPPTPTAFRWRRRWYVVTAMLARWVEADQWWTSATVAAAASQAPVSAGSALDRVVWRVEARPRHGANVGVFDLCQQLLPTEPAGAEPVPHDALPRPGPRSAARRPSVPTLPTTEWHLVRSFD